MSKKPELEVRKNKPDGIRWRGYLYESVPKFGDEYIAIVEDCGDYLIVQKYKTGPHVYYRRLQECLVGEPVKVLKIGMGRPTQWRIDKLKEALTPKQVAARASLGQIAGQIKSICDNSGENPESALAWILSEIQTKTT